MSHQINQRFCESSNETYEIVVLYSANETNTIQSFSLYLKRGQDGFPDALVAHQCLCFWSWSEIVAKGLWNSIIAIKVSVAVTVTFAVAVNLCIVVIRKLCDG